MLSLLEPKDQKNVPGGTMGFFDKWSQATDLIRSL
jgi:hypothetical protein